MSRGQWLPLNVTGLTTSLFTFGPNTTLDYMDKGAHDPLARQLRFFGHSHMGDQRYHVYDERTNTFSNAPDPSWDGVLNGSPSYIGHGYQHNTIDPATGDQYYRLYNSSTIWKQTASTGAWSKIASAPNTEITGGLEWLPSIGTQGGLVLFLGRSCHRWDKATNSWSTPASGTLTQTYHTVAVRSVPNGVVVFGGGNAGRRMWKIGATGGAVPIPDCPIDVGIGSSVTTACPVSGDIIVIRSNSSAARFSVATNTWSTFTLPAGAPAFGTVIAESMIVATPLASYGVILFIFGRAPSMWLHKAS